MSWTLCSHQAPLLISMGCPAGVGPEIICKLFASAASGKAEKLVGNLAVVGDLGLLRQTAAELGIGLDFFSWLPGQSIPLHRVAVYQPDPKPLGLPINWGQPNRTTGLFMGRCIEAAVALIRQGHGAGLVTCPINKKNLHQAGYIYPGHTEMLAALTGAGEVRMMMAGGRLKVVLVTIHEPLRQVAEMLSIQSIVDCIKLSRQSMRVDFGCEHPRIAVAAFNPHAGEGGLFGDEERRFIGPAIASFAPDDGVSGPWPPDTVFYQAASGAYDLVIAMYHDQGLIPFKLLHFKDGVNVTLGLPLVRTSVDHGTAYDIAGKGLADASSLIAAVELATAMLHHRRRRRL